MASSHKILQRMLEAFSRVMTFSRAEGKRTDNLQLQQIFVGNTFGIGESFDAPGTDFVVDECTCVDPFRVVNAPLGIGSRHQFHAEQLFSDTRRILARIAETLNGHGRTVQIQVERFGRFLNHINASTGGGVGAPLGAAQGYGLSGDGHPDGARR